MNNNDDNDIRHPDPVKMERLIDDDFDNTDYHGINTESNYDLNTILEISKHEFNSLQEQEEQKTIELICNQTKQNLYQERENKFKNVKIQLNKIIPFDTSNLNYYELILSIIEMYELGFINEYKINLNEYTNISRILKTVRLPNDEIDNFKKIIVCE